MSISNFGIRRGNTANTLVEDHISLSDQTHPVDEEPQTPLTPNTPATLDGGAPLSQPPTVARVGTNRLRDGIARRKYARYQKERYEDEDVGTTDEDTSAGPSTPTTKLSSDLQRSATIASTTGESKTKDGRLRRGQQKVRGLIYGKRQRRKKDGDTEIDILWENQRGSFFFGRPYYSSQSLWPFDPPAWTNFSHAPSAVDISNATVPDPSWEWAWKSWYVDMSLDCDEQGWQYSFMFQTRFSWHGTHPWFHSFVRRRRWIRKRVRKHRHLPDGRVEGGDAMKEAHRLNADYFTIHPPANGRSPDSSYPPSTTAPTANVHNMRIPLEEEPEGVDNIRLLIKRLRKATVDREKVHLVLQFMDEGGQDIHYLAEEMPHIMSIFMYQYSRKQLLAGMLRKIDGIASDHRDEGRAKGKGKGKENEKEPRDVEDKPSEAYENASEQMQMDLRKAVEAADQQLKDFEYWSDIKGMVQSGLTLTGADEEHGWGEGWQGLDRSGPVVSPVSDPNVKPV